MPTPKICEGYGLTPGTLEYDDCLNYRGEYSEKYKGGGKIKNVNHKGGRRSARDYSAGGKYSSGGMLVGPSHEEGGIDVIVDGTEPIEVEGGEFVINKQTVDAVGEDFLHKLNSTETEHHIGGYDEGQLPSPSQFKDGGKINNRRSEMARGRRAPKRTNTGRAPARRMARGGRTRPAPRGGGRPTRRMGGCVPGTPGCPQGGGYRRGGRTKPITTRGMARGGRTGVRQLQSGGSSTSRSGCTMWTGEIDCNNTSGCTWNYSTGMCH